MHEIEEANRTFFVFFFLCFDQRGKGQQHFFCKYSDGTATVKSTTKHMDNALEARDLLLVQRSYDNRKATRTAASLAGNCFGRVALDKRHLLHATSKYQIWLKLEICIQERVTVRNVPKCNSSSSRKHAMKPGANGSSHCSWAHERAVDLAFDVKQTGLLQR